MNAVRPMPLFPTAQVQWDARMPDGKRYRNVARPHKSNGRFVVIAAKNAFGMNLKQGMTCATGLQDRRMDHSERRI